MAEPCIDYRQLEHGLLSRDAAIMHQGWSYANARSPSYAGYPLSGGRHHESAKHKWSDAPCTARAGTCSGPDAVTIPDPQADLYPATGMRARRRVQGNMQDQGLARAIKPSSSFSWHLCRQYSWPDRWHRCSCVPEGLASSPRSKDGRRPLIDPPGPESSHWDMNL
jgi:hypothetical protein